jgi:hypothetical protein
MSTTDEFYAIDEAVPRPRLDRAELDLKRRSRLSPVQQANYDALSAQLSRILSSQPACPGDGNIDGRVDRFDVADWKTFALLARGKSSWYDLNLDGLTNGKDLAIVREHMGTNCGK